MSAFMVSDAHIDYLISAFKQYSTAPRPTFEELDPIAWQLITANWLSVSYRYGAAAREAWQAPAPHCLCLHTVEPVQTLKLLACYEYQSCEAPTWESSAARKWCDTLRSMTIAALPGYDAAHWSIADDTPL